MPIQRINRPSAPTQMQLGVSRQGNAGAVTNVIAYAMGQWADHEVQQLQQKAQVNIQRQATIAQSELGTEGLAQAPSSLAQKYQLAYQQKAREVLNLQIKRDAATQASQLRREHVMDPDGFANAWDSWSSGVVEGFHEQAPAFAVEVKGYLNSFGSQNYSTLANAEAARQREQLSTNAIAATNEHLAASTDLLLNSPSNEDYTSAVSNIHDNLAGMVEQGLISSSNALKYADDTEVDLTKAYVRGQFKSRIASGDNEGAASLIQSLHSGRYFKDNETAFALADELQSSLKASGGAGTDRASRLSDVLEIEHDAVANGRPSSLSLATLNGLVSKIGDYGSQEQKEKARTQLTSIIYQKRFTQGIKSASLEELNNLDLSLVQSRFGLTSEMRTHLADLVQDQKAIVATAKRTNNPSLLTDEMAPISTQDPEELTNFIAQQQQQFYRATGIAPSHQPTYGPEERKAFTQEFDQAVRSGDIDRASLLIENYAAPNRGDPSALHESVAQLQERGGLFYGAVTLHSMGSTPEAKRLVQLAGDGLSASPDALNSIEGVLYDRTLAAQQLANGDFGADIIQGIQNISFGSSTVKSSVISSVLNAYEGALLQYQDEDEAKAEIARILEPWIEGVEFSNGSQLSTMYISDGGVVKTINHALENPSVLGIPPSAAENVNRIVPKPLPGGAIGFYDPLEGNFLVNPNNANQPYTVVAPVPTAVPEPDNDTSWLEDIGNGLDSLMSWAGDVRNKAIYSDVGSQVGASPQMLSAIYTSAQQVDAQGAGDRTGEVLLQPTWANEISEQDVLDVPRDNVIRLGDVNITNADAQPAYAALALNIAEGTFPNSKEKQLAMYWLGPDETENLTTTHGSDWMDYIDPETEAFITRAMMAFRSNQVSE